MRSTALCCAAAGPAKVSRNGRNATSAHEPAAARRTEFGRRPVTRTPHARESAHSPFHLDPTATVAPSGTHCQDVDRQKRTLHSGTRAKKRETRKPPNGRQSVEATRVVSGGCGCAVPVQPDVRRHEHLACEGPAPRGNAKDRAARRVPRKSSACFWTAISVWCGRQNPERQR